MTATVAPMSAEQTAIHGLWRLTCKAVTDERGTVREFFRTSGFADAGVDVPARSALRSRGCRWARSTARTAAPPPR